MGLDRRSTPETPREPDGPTPGQGQYRPWYRKDTPVTDYLFCISGRLANENQRDSLRDEIKSGFVGLATDHPYLSHLGGITVRVLDWGSFEGILRNHPFLLFRWFPRTRPVGLTPLEKQPPTNGFRDYLTEDRLPYLSRTAFRQQQENLVPETEMDDETALLRRLDDGEVTGLVITGGGGVGKTRLAFELGWKANDAGWTVLVVGSTLRSKALTDLTERVLPETKVLLIFDYIETQKNFVELANELTDLRNTYALRLHFVANCRSSYYHVLEGAIEHRRVELSPNQAITPHDLTIKYRHAVVRYILQQGVPGFDARHLDLCRDVPVFAVFLSYLVANDRQPWLEELLIEKDFGTWVASRVKRTLRDEGIDEDLALLMSLFPMPHSTIHQLDHPFRRIVDCLSTDGWISELPDETATWVTAHDVLADRIVLSYLEQIGGTATLFVERLLTLAQAWDLLRPCLTTLQRMAEQPLVNSLPWQKIFHDRCSSHLEQWKPVRDLLMRTSLLSETETLGLIESCPALWQGAETEVEFQNAIGWLARWACRNDHGSQLTETQQATLTDWVCRAATHANQSNFVLTSAIHWCPNDVRELAAKWMSDRPTVFQTHYLIVAWLKMKLPWEEIKDTASRWLARNPASPHVSFVVTSWLDAAGKDGLDLVREPIRHWLSSHQTARYSQFVYKSWLNAAKQDGLGLVQGPIEQWLHTYKTEPEASHVYKAWLDAAGKGGLELVRDPIRQWLQAHEATVEAQFVYNSWLDAAGNGGLDLVREPIRQWLQTHEIATEAQFVYKSWLDAAGSDGLDLVQKPIRQWLHTHKDKTEAQFIYNSWLDATGKDHLELVQEPIRQWLQTHQADFEASHVYKSWLDATGEDGLEMVRDPIRQWLQTHQTYFEAQFVYNAWLDAAGNEGLDLVQEPIRQWLSCHGETFAADHVFRAWLESDGDFPLVRDAAVRWLRHHRDHYDAVYVTKSLAKQPSLESSAIRDILFWARTFCNDEDALFRTTQLRSHLFNQNVASELIETAEVLLNTRGIRIDPPESWLLDSLCSYLICARSLDKPAHRSRVDAWYIDWFRHGSSFRDSPRPKTQRPQFMKRLAELLYAEGIDAAGDEAALRKFLGWVNRWADLNKDGVRELCEELAAAFPAPGLWGILTFKAHR